MVPTPEIPPAPPAGPETDATGPAFARPELSATDPDLAAFDADAAVESAGDEFNVQGFDVSTFTSLVCGYLKINSVWATVADLTIFRNGIVDFDYHCFDGNPHDPGELTAITLAILHDDDRGGEAARYAHMDFLFSVGRAVIEQGLRAVFGTLDPVNAYWRISDEVEIFHPDRPERGTVRVATDGALWWRCQLRDQPSGAAGLDLTEITSSIVRAIGSAQVAKCEEMRTRTTTVSSRQPATVSVGVNRRFQCEISMADDHASGR